jgi:hypothetical protein
MNKVYFAGPVLAMLLFTGIYISAQSGVKERHAAAELQAKTERENKIKADNEARRKAVADALLAQETRKKEREEREAREAKEKEERQLAIDARDKSYREQDRLSRQVDRLKKDIDTEKAAIAKINDATALVLAEETFLKEFVQKARGNVKALETLLNQIAAAETARAAAAAAAANAKKTS